MTRRARPPVDSGALTLRYRIGPHDPWQDAAVLHLGKGELKASLQAPVAADTQLELDLSIGEGTGVRGTGRVVWTPPGEARSALCVLELDEYASSMIELCLTRSKLHRGGGD